jgi:flagellar assembly factor FliW
MGDVKIETRQFGELDIREEDIVKFERGLPGFEQLKRFIFVEPDPDLPFSFLQSVEDADVAFIVTNPFLFYPDYEFELSPSVQEELNIVSERDVAVWSVVTVREKASDATVNLLAPLVVNVKEKRGRQIVLHDSGYGTKHPLFREKPPAAEAGEDRHARVDT